VRGNLFQIQGGLSQESAAAGMDDNGQIEGIPVFPVPVPLFISCQVFLDN